VGALKYTNNRLVAVVVVIILGMASLIGVNIGLAHETMGINEGSKTILIDAGHGGMDGGTSSKNGTVEKDINLSIVKKLKVSLEKSGYKVVMTREGDVGLYSNEGTIRQRYIEDLKKRCDLKKSSNCDMLISIHLNYFTQSKYYGAQVWYSNYKESSTLASIIQSNLKADLDPSNKRIQKPAKNAYKILRVNDDMPSVLVECGFLSNYEEEQKLKSDEYQQKIADSICKSTNEFLKTFYKGDSLLP
jgi:N-acetylmuramoyl-L-alanine amidase